jgi:DNA-binding CsgD family transcriptional regulator
MQENERLLTLIGDIYDAALDPALWTPVLGKTRDFVRGQAAAIFRKDAISKSGNSYYQDGGIDPHYERIYFEEYIKLDPANIGHCFAGVGEALATADLLPYDDFLNTRMYKEWAQPQGLVDFVSVVLEKSAASAAMLGVFRHERDGVADEGARRRLQLLAPHVRRAVLIGRVIDLKVVESATFADTLDGLSAGMFLVDAAGRIIHTNMAGYAMLGMGDVLHNVSGKLAANDPDADRDLCRIFAAAGCGDAALGIGGICVPLTAPDGERYVAHVLPLTSGARRRAGALYASVAAVFVHNAALEVPSPPEAIAKAYQLTSSELRVLLAIVEVGGARDVAKALGIAEATAKTHLAHLYEKTGTNRQADLVKLAAGFSSPLVK